MGVKAKRFTYDVLLEDGGVLLADGEGAIDAPEAWKPDHFLVAALLITSVGPGATRDIEAERTST